MLFRSIKPKLVIGADYSGNNNTWNAANISTTNDTTYDLMIDSPTNTASGTQPVGNYCTLNPLAKSSSVTLSNANLTATGSAVSNNRPFTGTQKLFNYCYWEMTMTSFATNNARSPVGVVQIPFSPSTFADDTMITGSGVDTVVAQPTAGVTQANATVYSAPFTWSASDIMMFAYNNGKIWMGRNGTWWNSGDPAAGTGQVASGMTGESVPFANCYNATVWNANFGQRPFDYTPPTGFKSFCTTNLPDSTVLQGNKYMDATTYTGTGATQSIVNAAGFKPDLVWCKQRNGTQDHYWFDSIRGATVYLTSTSTNGDNSVANTLTSFNSNGYSSGGNSATNGSTLTYVGWQWQAGQGTTSSNTSGSITSTVSVSTTAGFSIVTYTGTGANATVGHGLGVAPSMFIIKSRSGATDWVVYHSAIGATKALFLNKTSAQDTSISYFNNTAPTSTLFSIGYGADVNPNTANLVAYCFAEIAGFSKFGSYTGNGSADGPFVYTGFRPTYVLIKRTDAVENWVIFDNARNPYNVETTTLEPNLTAADSSSPSNAAMDLVSNGFKLRCAAGINTGTWIYAAFAENPTKYANAR